MLIEGPLRVSVAEMEGGGGWVLVLGFKPDFQALDLTFQSKSFREYLQQLNDDIAELDAGDRNRAGMLIIQQIVEQLLPHVESGELELGDSITVQIQQKEQVVALTDLLKGAN